MRRILGTVLALVPAVGALAAGCSVSAPGAASGPPQIIQYVDGGDAGMALSEGGNPDAAPAGMYGNRLCAGLLQCDPDNSPSNPYVCKLPDAGVIDPTDGGLGMACRVVPTNASDGGPPATMCSVASTGTSGMQCQSAADCAPGFDCVSSATGDAGLLGTCRHYCCSGSCENKHEFCDIQPLAVASTTKVPVCMPITPPGGCELIAGDGGSSCPPNQTCAIVRDDGTTGCVEVGSRTQNQPCDTDHCGSGLVCLGSVAVPLDAPGARKCYQLCSTSTAAAMEYGCPMGTTCQGGLPLFQDPSVGICR
jgi:hypothetical protein